MRTGCDPFVCGSPNPRNAVAVDTGAVAQDANSRELLGLPDFQGNRFRCQLKGLECYCYGVVIWNNDFFVDATRERHESGDDDSRG